MIKDIRPALKAFLLDNTGIRALVGGKRIFPSVLPQTIGTRTSLVYQSVSELGDFTMRGPSGLTAMRLQIDAWSADVDQVTELANLVKARIDGFRGTWPATTPIKIRGVFFDGVVPIDWDDAVKMHRDGRLYMIHFIER